MIFPRYFCPSHFNCVDYDIFSLTKWCSGSTTGPYIYIYIYIYIYNMWISLETSRTESLVIFNLCYQLSLADFFVQKHLIKQNLTSVESGVFGAGKTSTER